jgi:signal transduction histidine kinase
VSDATKADRRKRAGHAGAFEGVALDLATSDNRKIPAFASAIERRDDAGRLIVTRVALFRATDRRQYERDLVSARQAAEQANDDLQAHGAEVEESLRLERVASELREQFIAVLGHDLRNPLAARRAGNLRGNVETEPQSLPTVADLASKEGLEKLFHRCRRNWHPAVRHGKLKNPTRDPRPGRGSAYRQPHASAR